MKTIALILMALALLGLAACGGSGGAKPNGWTKADRESLTQDCIGYVIAKGDLSNSYASRYCECWIGGMEAHYTADYADTIINGGEMPDPEVITIGTDCLNH